MSQFAERIREHQVFAEMEEFRKALELARESCSQDQALIDNWDRAGAISAHVRLAINQADPLLIVVGNLANMASYFQQARSEINSFVANKNAGHWTNAQNHLDNCLAQLAALPRQTPEGIGGMLDAASDFRTTISGWLDAIKRDGDGISQMQGALQTRINEAAAEIATQKQRLDTAIATFQQQFSDAQQARQTEFAAQEQVRALAATKSEQERQAAFEKADEARAEAEKQAAATAAQEHAALATKLKADVGSIISAMETQKAHAQKLIGIITDTGMAYGYQKTANEERDEAALWKKVTSGALGFWILAGLVIFWLTYDRDLTWPTVVRQLLISTPFILLAGFAALQVSRHQHNERDLRQAELELASIDPFLATLKDDERNAVKREFATRYFGHRENEEKSGGDEKLAENVLEITKILKELKKTSGT